MNDSEKPSTPQEALAHYGTKGMKWGVRRDAQTGVRPLAKTLDQSRFGKVAKKNAQRHMSKQATKGAKQGIANKVKSGAREFNKATKAHDTDVRLARSNLPHTKAALKTAKAQYKVDKKIVGRREAKKALAPVRDKHYKTWSKASEHTTAESLSNMLVNPHFDKRATQNRGFTQAMMDEYQRSVMKAQVRDLVDRR